MSSGRRWRPSITLELLLVMTSVLLISLVLVVTASDQFLRGTGKALVQDQDRVAKEIIEHSVEALKKQGENGLSTAVRDKAKQLD